MCTKITFFYARLMSPRSRDPQQQARHNLAWELNGILRIWKERYSNPLNFKMLIVIKIKIYRSELVFIMPK